MFITSRDHCDRQLMYFAVPFSEKRMKVSSGVRPCDSLTHLDDTCPISELGPEQYIRIVEQPILQTDDDELRALEPILEQLADMLRMRKIQSRIDLVQNVHRRGLELEERHDERQSDERPLTAAQLRQALLPNCAELHFDFETGGEVPCFGIDELSVVAWQEVAEDVAKVPFEHG